MSKSLLVALAIAAAGACAKSPPDPWAPHDTSVDPGYHVVNNQVLDKTDAVHYFHGVARPSLEWSASGENISIGDFKHMASWKANAVRIALNQDSWLFGTSPKTYEQTVVQAVEWAKQAGLDVILDLHWSDQGQQGTVSPGQQKMADVNSIAFWKSVADFYKDDGRVLFELYNEPHDVSWDVWLNGGDAGGFTAVGMQQLYDAVRSTGANNIVIAGGLDWAYDLSGVPDHRIQGENIMYATHPYSKGNWKPISGFDAKWGFLTATAPVIVSEFGDNVAECTTDYSDAVITYADRAGASWTGWAWYPGGCTFPSLIADWTGTPTAMGAVVKAALARYSAQGMPITEDGGIAQPKLDSAAPDLPSAVDSARGDVGLGIDLTGAIDLPVTEAGID
ncbi:MAG TPA: glycoside hydrolase family 5 protein [Polyangia bacterium]